MAKQRLDGSAIRYAVRIARRLELSESEIRSMVHAAIQPHMIKISTIRAGAEILAVVAVFHSLRLSGRDREGSLTLIKRYAGSHLDPEVVGEFLSVIRDDAAGSFAAMRPAECKRGTAA